jgi:hypothetical protein
MQLACRPAGPTVSLIDKKQSADCSLVEYTYANATKNDKEIA